MEGGRTFVGIWRKVWLIEVSPGQRRKSSLNADSHSAGNVLVHLRKSRMFKDSDLSGSIHTCSERDLLVPHDSKQEFFGAEIGSIIVMFRPKNFRCENVFGR